MRTFGAAVDMRAAGDLTLVSASPAVLLRRLRHGMKAHSEPLAR